MSKEELKFFKPAMQGRNTGVDIKVGDKNTHIDIPAGGYRAQSKEEEKALLKHELLGHSFGFIAIDPKDLKNEKVPIFNGEPTLEVEGQTAKPATPKVEIIEEETPEEEEETGDEDEKAETETVKSEDTPDTNKDGKITAEDVTKIQQAKDFLKDELGVDGRVINSPDKILEKAKELNVSFPNLETK